MHSLFLFTLFGFLGVQGDSAGAVLVVHGDLLGFPCALVSVSLGCLVFFGSC